MHRRGDEFTHAGRHRWECEATTGGDEFGVIVYVFVVGDRSGPYMEQRTGKPAGAPLVRGNPDRFGFRAES